MYLGGGVGGEEDETVGGEDEAELGAGAALEDERGVLLHGGPDVAEAPAVAERLAESGAERVEDARGGGEGAVLEAGVDARAELASHALCCCLAVGR